MTSRRTSSRARTSACAAPRPPTSNEAGCRRPRPRWRCGHRPRRASRRSSETLDAVALSLSGILPVTLESTFMPEPLALTLAGKGVLVTGASSGIGRAIALAMAHAGADVAVTYRENRAGADAVAREIQALGRKVSVQALDLSDEAAIDRVAS